MRQIRWFEAHPDGDLLERVRRFDHHCIDIDGVNAVLMTYVDMDSPERGLLAVVHPAADRHPEVPPWVTEAVAKLVWEPRLPPER